MGYFSNGAEGMDYEERYCNRCFHQRRRNGCAVWEAHQLANYEECNKPESVLHVLIPRLPDGRNDECAMFLKRGFGLTPGTQ